MKKIIFIFLTLALAFSLAGCGKKPAATVVNFNTEGVPDTGRIIDATSLNNQTVTTTPGDIIEIKLTGDNDKQHQWNCVSAQAADYVSLNSHKFDIINDQSGSKFVSDWLLKVQKAGSFGLQFDYSKLNQKPEKSFKLQVISE